VIVVGCLTKSFGSSGKWSVTISSLLPNVTLVTLGSLGQLGYASLTVDTFVGHYRPIRSLKDRSHKRAMLYS
jgi:hypothetical protein